MTITRLRYLRMPNGWWRAYGHDPDAPDANDTSYYGGGRTQAEALAELMWTLWENRRSDIRHGNY